MTLTQPDYHLKLSLVLKFKSNLIVTLQKKKIDVGVFKWGGDKFKVQSSYSINCHTQLAERTEMVLNNRAHDQVHQSVIG